MIVFDATAYKFKFDCSFLLPKLVHITILERKGEVTNSNENKRTFLSACSPCTSPKRTDEVLEEISKDQCAVSTVFTCKITKGLLKEVTVV